MPIFRVTISRTYTENEGFERYIEAADAAEAEDLGNELVRRADFDNDVPDDCAVLAGGYNNEDAYFEVEDTFCAEPVDVDEGALVWTEAMIYALEEGDGA